MMPVLILDPPRDTLVMRDEIFGPILPILGYRSIDDALETIRSVSCPLAIYYFGADDERASPGPGPHCYGRRNDQ